MTGTPPSPAQASGRAPQRSLLWIAVVAGCLAVFGLLTGPRIGGLGPSLFWAGLGAAALAGGAYTILARLAEPRVRALAPLFAGLAAAAQTTALALLMLEAVSWHRWVPTQPIWVLADTLDQWHRPHRQLGWVPATDYETVVAFPTGPQPIALNSRGFRDIEQRPDPSRPHVVILGDSYPVGWGGTLADSMGPRLREVLPEAQVFNASWTGWAKDQIAMSYALRARDLAPRVVLVMFMAEPGVDGSRPLYQGLRKPWFVLRDGKPLLRGVPIDFNATEASNRRLYRAFEAESVDGPGAAWRFLTHDFPRRYLAMGQRLFPDYDWVEIRRSGFPPLDPLEWAILADLKRQVEADGAHMILATAPPRRLFEKCRDPVAAMRPYLASFRGLGEPVDLTPYVVKDFAACYNPQQHPNAEGMNRVRGELARRIREVLR